MADESNLSTASHIAQIVGLVPSFICAWDVLSKSGQSPVLGSGVAQPMSKTLLVSLVCAITCFLIGGFLQIVVLIQRRSRGVKRDPAKLSEGIEHVGKIRAELEDCQDSRRREGMQYDSQMERKDKAIDGCREDRRVALQKLKDAETKLTIFTPLQFDAVRLSNDLLAFLHSLGEEPSPKYTNKELVNMSTQESERLLREKDGDYTEASAYHFEDERLFVRPEEGVYKDAMAKCVRLRPWYERLRASYALDFRDRVERIRNQFALEGLSDEALLLVVEGSRSPQRIRAIAAGLWSLAYKAGEKRANP